MKRKAELVDLSEKAAEMKQAKLEDTEDYNKLLQEKLQTEDGTLPDPKTLTVWTNNFSDIPDLRSEICTAIWWEERNTVRKTSFL